MINLTVEGFEAKTRHAVRNELQPVVTLMRDTDSKILDRLEQINLSLTKGFAELIATVKKD